MVEKNPLEIPRAPGGTGNTRNKQGFNLQPSGKVKTQLPRSALGALPIGVVMKGQSIKREISSN